MNDARPERDRVWATLECPIVSGTVSICATYLNTDPDNPILVDFTCSDEGCCDNSAWDPCPLYIRCLEGRPAN